jgi:alpha-glucoside transport system substrate-binding protein
LAACAALLALAACTPPAAPSRPTGQIGGTVNVLATWGGEEQASFLAMVKPFEERTGVQVRYEGTRDLNAVLTTRVQGGNPPDVAALPGPGQMAELARDGKLLDLADALDAEAMKREYAEDWLKLGQVEGKQVGIFIKTALKGLVWYNPKAFKAAGHTIPTSWDELMALSIRIAASGSTPWCIGLESGAASGWPATDWLENIILRQSGPQAYDRWARGELKWSSPEIKRAWETWGLIATADGMVLGGRQGLLATAFGDAGNPMLSSPPRCYLHQQGSFITDFFVKANPGVKPGEDFDFFPFPPIDQRYKEAVEAAGDLMGMFRDTPQARALLRYLATAEAQEIWVKRGGALSANRRVPAASYPDDLARKLARTLTEANIVRFDGSDLMPEAMNNAFWKASLDYVNNPSSLDSVLSTLDRVQGEAYARR